MQESEAVDTLQADEQEQVEQAKAAAEVVEDAQEPEQRAPEEEKLPEPVRVETPAPAKVEEPKQAAPSQSKPKDDGAKAAATASQ